MRIALASDHAGYDLKEAVGRFLSECGVATEDFGARAGEVVDYIDPAEKACRAVLDGACDRAVLICGTGIGMSMVANKFRGIRGTLCWNSITAEMAREHNDSNCLTLGGRILDVETAREIVRIWLVTPFDGGRHARRLEKLAALEIRNCRS
jgi:ribose 5-phosphate isomerase B